MIRFQSKNTFFNYICEQIEKDKSIDVINDISTRIDKVYIGIKLTFMRSQGGRIRECDSSPLSKRYCNQIRSPDPLDLMKSVAEEELSEDGVRHCKKYPKTSMGFYGKEALLLSLSEHFEEDSLFFLVFKGLIEKARSDLTEAKEGKLKKRASKLKADEFGERSVSLIYWLATQNEKYLSKKECALFIRARTEVAEAFYCNYPWQKKFFYQAIEKAIARAVKACPFKDQKPYLAMRRFNVSVTCSPKGRESTIFSFPIKKRNH